MPSAKRDYGEPVELARSDLRGVWPLFVPALLLVWLVVAQDMAGQWKFVLVVLAVLLFVVPALVIRWLVGRNAIFADGKGLIVVYRGRARRSHDWSRIRDASWYRGSFWLGWDPAGIQLTKMGARRELDEVRIGTLVIVRRRDRRAVGDHVDAYLSSRLHDEALPESPPESPPEATPPPVAPQEWWKGVLYHVYLRSFADSDGDGVGDLRGLIGKLDHLASLGVDVVWVSPVMPSPNADWGYDVADYCAVDPEYGSLADVDELVAQAGERGMRVLFDLVPNHTSEGHPWFGASRSSRDDPKRDWYVWRDPKPDGSPPNNWVASFFGSAWQLDERTGQYYLHSFLEAQPDLNWWNEGVRAAFDDVLRFWFDRGVAGFRIDVVHKLVKDPGLRDNPPATDSDSFIERVWGQRELHNANHPETLEILRRWRKIADGYAEERALVGETYIFDLSRLGAYYGGGDQLHLAFNMPFLWAPFRAEAVRAVVEETMAALPADAWPVWNGGSHDISRFPSRWCGGDPRKIRVALMMLLTLRGTPLLYYGDEIGMTDGPVTVESALDPLARRAPVPTAGRDPSRTPMQWNAGPGAGFTAPHATPWLPIGDAGACNVDGQTGHAASNLELCRRLITLRREEADLREGGMTFLDSAPGVLAWRRGERTTVALNLSDKDAALDGPRGVVRAGTRPSRDGHRLEGRLWLEPWEGAVLYE